MYKKAFTLIELIATVIVLAIILAITVPSINGIIKSVHHNAYQLNLKSMRDGSTSYMLKEGIELSSGTTIIVTIDDMVEANVITPVLDPKSKLECEGYVVVFKENKKYEHTAYLKCGDNFISDNYGVTDFNNPVITMLGSNPINIAVGNIYIDAGAMAIDDVDGDITDRMVITSNINTGIPSTYSITYTVEDNAGNTTSLSRIVNVVDISAPLITITGDNPTNINVGDIYSDGGATALDDVDGDITSRITTTGTVNPSVVGTYTITYTVSDTAGHEAIAIRTINVIDDVLPTVAFGMNGNTTWAKTRSTTVTASDAHTGVNISSLKYQWTTNTITPIEASFTTGFINGGVIATPSGATGEYYLWVLAKDNVNNTTITRTNIFNIDNTIPVITMVGSSSVTVIKGAVYNDAGATAIDSHSGISGSVTSTGTINLNVVGQYLITYNVSDNAGNIATPVVRTVNVIEAPVYTFTNAGVSGRYGPTQTQINASYAGTSLTGIVAVISGIQQITIPYTGTYRIDVRGAQGGSTSTSYNYSGGLGAKMIGDFSLTAGEVIKIVVGQQPVLSTYCSSGGGGGSFVYKATGNVLMIAAGGGGGAGDGYGGANGVSAVTSTSGTAGYTGLFDGGTNGSGGISFSSTGGTAGGGGGWTGNGVNGNDSGGGTTLSGSFVGGYKSSTFGTDGGFGGGGGGSWSAGGGGGYSGGGAGYTSGSYNDMRAGGGGGSYNNGTNQSNTAGFNSGHGRVIITLLP